MPLFHAHVEAGFEAAHANGPEGHRCAIMHGHSWRAEIEWMYDETMLSEYGWGPDFGAVKDIVRSLDHKNLNEELSFAPSAEHIAIYLHGKVHGLFPDLIAVTVRVYEGGGNWVEVVS